jgi:hypothetical protein
MEMFQDWVILALAAATGLCLYFTMSPRRRPEVWLIVLTVLLFALPRAGVMLRQVQLPLPLGYVLAAVMIVEWLVFREIRQREGHRHINLFFLLYAAAAGFGLILGLSAEGHYLTAFLELCFYLFAIGLFFYASETFSQPRHFRIFTRLVLVIAIFISLYGIAQRYLGSSILLNNLTYNSGSETAKTYLEIDAARRRVLSSYGDPNVLAGQLVMFYGIALALALGRRVSFRMRLAGTVVVILSILCIYCTGSRAGLLCLLVVPIGVLASRSRWALLLAPAAIAAGAIGYDGWRDFLLADRLSLETLGGDLRVQFPVMAWEMLKQYPLGCGLGRAITVKLSGLNWILEADSTTTLWSGFNSFWLNLFSRLGVAGVSAFVMLLAVLLTHVVRQTRRIWDPDVKAFILGGVSGLIGVILIWLVNNTYMLPGGELNFWFMLGLLTAGCRCFTMSPQPVLLAPVGSEYRLLQAVPV